MRRAAVTSVVASTLHLSLAVALCAAPALGQSPAAVPPSSSVPPVATVAPAGPSGTATVTPSHGVTPLVAALARGAEAYHRRDYDTALAAFREAAERDGQSPTPRLFMGYVQAVRGDQAGALATFREALRLAAVAGDDQARARVLAALAMTDEAQGHWDDALLSWQDDARFADAHPTVGYPASAHARAEAIQHRAALDQQYAPVRQRIADRLRANAVGQGAAGDAAAAGTSVTVPVTPPTPQRPQHP